MKAQLTVNIYHSGELYASKGDIVTILSDMVDRAFSVLLPNGKQAVVHQWHLQVIN